MSQKRQQDSGKARSEGTSSDDKRRKLPSLRNVILEVMSMRKVQLCMEPVLEPLIRRVVKEEVELALRKYLTNMKWNYGKEIQSSESRSLELLFLPKISLPVFTGTRIEGEDCNAFKVALINALTGHIVCSGIESSAKVEILVLEGDFDGDERGNWTPEEFNSNIVREREGKKPLLAGDTILNLKDGIGLVSEISFTDNSSWTRRRKFRLGARVVDKFDGVRVKEAKTQSFIVRDHRGELYKKHHPPSLLDDVWRLEKIGKEGAFHKRLSREKVSTVKDFLTLLYLDPARLRKILGTGMSAKMWEITVDHARTCVLDSRVYFHRPAESQQKTGIVFNIVGQVMGLLSECQYVTVDKLSEAQQAEARNAVIAAFKNWEGVVPFNDEASLLNASSCLFNNVPFNTSGIGVGTSDQGNLLTPGGFDYAQSSACCPDSIPSIFSVDGLSSLDHFELSDLDNIDLGFSPLNFPGEAVRSLISETESIPQTFGEDDHLQYFDAADSSLPQSSNAESQTDLENAVTSFLLARSAAFAQKRWTMVFSVLKWFSIRRIVAKKSRIKETQKHHSSQNRI